jgi:hypothetical protein
MTEYMTEITKDNRLVTVYGELWDDGVGYWDSWGDTGQTFEVQHEPEFSITEAYDAETGVSIPLTELTPSEVYCIIEIFTSDYWDHIFHV